jgi:hypothetical protein
MPARPAGASCRRISSGRDVRKSGRRACLAPGGRYNPRMSIDRISGWHRLRNLALAALVASTVAGNSLAQGAPASASPVPAFPGSATLPEAPNDMRLPGPNPRHCGSTRYSALCAEGRWANFANMRVELKAPRFSGAYSMEQPQNGDVHTTYREQAGSTRRGGEIVFINDDAFAFRSRDRFQTPETILDEMMSTPILVTQLAALLLDQGALVGPGEITTPLPFSARNATQYLRTEAPNAAALFGPPWEVTGSVAPAADGMLAFRLRLSYRPVDRKGRIQAGKRDTVELTGTVAYGERRKAMSDTFDLVGWKLMLRNSEIDPVKSMDEARQAVAGR